MPIAVHYLPESMNRSVFTKILDRLNAEGLGAPKGRTLHVCYGPETALQVFDVWETQEDLDAFSTLLGPILEEVGLKLASIEVHEVVSVSNETGAIDLVRTPAATH